MGCRRRQDVTGVKKLLTCCCAVAGGDGVGHDRRCRRRGRWVVVVGIVSVDCVRPGEGLLTCRCTEMGGHASCVVAVIDAWGGHVVVLGKISKRACALEV